MKCRSCRAENPDSVRYCVKCGEKLSIDGNPSQLRDQRMAKPLDFSKTGKPIINSKDIARQMKRDYTFTPKGQDFRVQEALQQLIPHFQKPQFNLRSFLEDVGKMIYRQFDIAQVSIGRKDPKDNLYRYEVLIGLRKEVEAAHRQIAYTYNEFWNSDIYKGTRISKYTKVFLAEDNPYAEGEEGTYNRPLMLVSKRNSPEDTLEADYFDIHFFGVNDEMLGWIETSGTKAGKIPSIETIKWLEVLGMIIAAAIRMDQMRKGDSRPARASV